MFGTAFSVIALCLIISAQALFPDDPVPCKYGDGKCIVQFTNSLLSQRSGEEDTSLNITRLDPLKVDRMVIDQGSDSAVGIVLKFTDCFLYGIKDLRFVGVKGFGKNLTDQHTIKVVGKQLSLVGPYTIQGKVLILPISGSGNSNITLNNLKAIIKFSGQPLEKDGETYLDITHLKVILKPQTISFLFTNLFNGDKALGDNMNSFLNQNSEAIYQEMGLGVDQAFNQMFFGLIQGVFAHRPYAKLFAEE